MRIHNREPDTQVGRSIRACLSVDANRGACNERRCVRVRHWWALDWSRVCRRESITLDTGADHRVDWVGGAAGWVWGSGGYVTRWRCRRLRATTGALKQRVHPNTPLLARGRSGHCPSHTVHERDRGCCLAGHTSRSDTVDRSDNRRLLVHRTMSVESDDSPVPPRRDRLVTLVSPLQAALGLLMGVSGLGAVLFAGQRTVLLAVAVVCLLLISFDAAMGRSSPPHRTAAVTAHTELITELERELRLNNDGWYAPTETGSIRCWYASTGEESQTPPVPLPEGLFHDDENAGVAIPPIGWEIIEQTDDPLPTQELLPGIKTALTTCQQAGLISEWKFESYPSEDSDQSESTIRLTDTSPAPSSADGTLILSLLGTATATILEQPVQVTLSDINRRERTVILRVSSTGD